MALRALLVDAQDLFGAPCHGRPVLGLYGTARVPGDVCDGRCHPDIVIEKRLLY
jgi:hypothetical protein